MDFNGSDIVMKHSKAKLLSGQLLNRVVAPDLFINQSNSIGLCENMSSLSPQTHLKRNYDTMNVIV